jgi:predicted amidohydrolase YtcJ
LDTEIGSIEVGKLADLVVLEKNLFDLDIEQIPEIRIVMTFLRGRWSTQRKSKDVCYSINLRGNLSAA